MFAINPPKFWTSIPLEMMHQVPGVTIYASYVSYVETKVAPVSGMCSCRIKPHKPTQESDHTIPPTQKRR